MIDHVIYGKEKYKAGENYHYFLAKPHEIFANKTNEGDPLNYYYRFDSTDIEITDNIHLYEWNKVLIFADMTISGIKEIRLYINFIKVETLNIGQGQLSLTYIAFCSKDPDNNYPLCVMKGLDVL